MSQYDVSTHLQLEYVKQRENVNYQSSPLKKDEAPTRANLEEEFRAIRFEDYVSMAAYRDARVRWITARFGPSGIRDPENYNYFCNLRI